MIHLVYVIIYKVYALVCSGIRFKIKICQPWELSTHSVAPAVFPSQLVISRSLLLSGAPGFVRL